MLPAPLTQEQVKNNPDLRMDEALSTQKEINYHLVRRFVTACDRKRSRVRARRTPSRVGGGTLRLLWSAKLSAVKGGKQEKERFKKEGGCFYE